MKNILTEALVNSATNASFIFSYTNSAKLRLNTCLLSPKKTMLATNVDNYFTLALEKFDKVKYTHTHMCMSVFQP